MRQIQFLNFSMFPPHSGQALDMALVCIVNAIDNVLAHW